MKLRLTGVLFIAAILMAAQGPPTPYSVVLTWTLSTTPGVTGQNIYRAPLASGVCGTFASITPTQLSGTATTYTDTTVVGGQSYCYAATALVGTAESGLSNTFQSTIPPQPQTGFGGQVK